MSDGYFVQNLSIRIGERQIVDDISFSLAPGEIVALAGASGAGKSMSAMTPFGLSVGVASGSAILDGTELVGLSESELSKVRAEKLGFVFQQPLTALTPHRTVRQHLQRSRDAGRRCQARQGSNGRDARSRRPFAPGRKAGAISA